MELIIYWAIDLVFLAVLTLGLYAPRHGRKDILIGITAANMGVMVVAASLLNISAEASLGVGLGLFGVLSIIRLRSSEIHQADVAYYFTALAAGLISGLGVGTPLFLGIALGLLLVMLAIVDSPIFLKRSRHQILTLDRVIHKENELKSYLEKFLEASSVKASVISTDLIQEKMVVDVVYKVEAKTATNPKAPGASRRELSHAATPTRSSAAAEKRELVGVK